MTGQHVGVLVGREQLAEEDPITAVIPANRSSHFDSREQLGREIMPDQV
jgi:hypothetical protein